MSRRIWEKLHLSILSDRVINMTSANSSVERSLGLVPRLWLRFGLVEMVVQAHVMDNAPFDILLGRPFFQAGLCRTIDFANGEQHITITDPATRHEVTIPTHTRGREGSRERGLEEAEINGFLWEEEHSEGVDGYG